MLPTLALATLAYPLVGPQGSVALLNANFLDSMHVFTPLLTAISTTPP